MAANQAERELWVAIVNHFQADKAPRAIFLSHAFHTLTQRDMSVDEYAKAMKKAAESKNLSLISRWCSTFLVAPIRSTPLARSARPA